MPFLQVDLDAKKKFPQVARGLGISVAEVALAFLDLWEPCFGGNKETITLIELECLFGAPGDRVARVLTAYDFLEPIDGVHRIKGAGRYKTAAEGRSKGGKAAAGNLKRGTANPRLQPGASREAAGEQPRLNAGSRVESRESISEKQPSPPARARENALRHADDAEPLAFIEAAAPLYETAARQAFVAPQNADIVAVLRQIEPDAQRLGWRSRLEAGLSAYALFLGSEHWRAKSPKPFPWKGFASQWRDFLLAPGAKPNEATAATGPPQPPAVSRTGTLNPVRADNRVWEGKASSISEGFD